MVTEHPALDHFLIDRDFHGSRVRIVPNDQVTDAENELRLLFPHEVVLKAPMGCSHTCVYTDAAPCSLVSDRIAEHVRDAGPEEPRPHLQPEHDAVQSRTDVARPHRSRVRARWFP